MLLNYPFDCENKALARRKVSGRRFVEKTDDARKVSVKPGKTLVYYREKWVGISKGKTERSKMRCP